MPPDRGRQPRWAGGEHGVAQRRGRGRREQRRDGVAGLPVAGVRRPAVDPAGQRAAARVGGEHEAVREAL